ncbi:MAG: hypothetical protein R3Y59_02875 [bacterium]
MFENLKRRISALSREQGQMQSWVDRDGITDPAHMWKVRIVEIKAQLALLEELWQDMLLEMGGKDN